jgi:hypothetical protein
MAIGHGGGGPSQSASNHPALASASAAPPYPRSGLILSQDVLHLGGESSAPQLIEVCNPCHRGLM